MAPRAGFALWSANGHGPWKLPWLGKCRDANRARA